MKIGTFLTCLVFGLVLGESSTFAASTVTRVEPSKKEVVTPGIDPADFKRVAGLIRDSIAASGVLTKIKGHRAIIGISTVSNRTSQRIHVDNLTGAITTALQEDASVMINRGIGPDGRPLYEDSKSAETAQVDRFLKGTKVAPQPDLGLSGFIAETVGADRKNVQRTYTIHMRLTQGEIVVWQGQEEFAKITKK